ncbi:alpha-amylase [Saccharophagus degradans]|uniref:glucan 1,4-alpha-maltotetraohydrolase domain-containing protein n=1 Tax=Saccharophagus degradans TaxID=86304 RepID=UPI001C091712|nr:glucan 1,4-alpha-maltotetraohydrolase domain-containing protein [Saccharophagus degradans]MBU2983887.1 alpha-amylase [Saccharophagus degradans]
MTNKLLLAASFSAVLATAAATHAATEQNQSSSAVLLQGFHWNSHDYDWYSVMQANVNSIDNLGATHVWFAPVSDAASDEGYLPRELYDVTTNYGTEQQLRTLVASLNAKGIDSVADIVINHRVGTTDWADFTNPTWGSWAVTCNDEWPGATGACDTGEGYAAARDIDHTNGTVQGDLISWIRDFLFNDIGFKGLRYDYSKGYDAYYAGLYANAVNPSFCVGEVWTDLNINDVNPHRQQLVDFVSGTGGACGVFDFTTKGMLNEALNNNDYGRLSINGVPSGAIGWWPQKMVTFVDNHDTGPSEGCGIGQNHWPVPCDKVMQGYAYILTHPGIPTVYWAHAYDWGMYDAIKALVDIRKSEGLTSTSSVDIKAAQNGLYAAVIDGKVAVKIGPNSWAPSGANWELKASGTNYAVWVIGEQPPASRTVIFVYGQTQAGQDMFIRGGIDHGYAAANLGKNCTSSNYECAIPIIHNNLNNATTAGWKANDNYLDWYGVEASQSSAAEGSAADWTTNVWPSSWGAERTVAVDGYGVTPLNVYGQHYWMLDVEMDCSATVNGWFELKTYISNGPGWEADVNQSGTPYASGNHFAQCGKINVFSRGSSNATIVDF